MGLFERKVVDGKKQVPVWFMRQAGRYHDHYQSLKKDHDFETLCKVPELACEVTMGPINDFNFDAAILFSDLLFPLEQLGLGLSYKTGGPTLEKKITTLSDWKNVKIESSPDTFYAFQHEACRLIRARLPKEKNLIGFVGAPFTLFTYATCGAHSGSLVEAKTGLYDGRFDYFVELLTPNLLAEIYAQINGGADTIALFDTAVGELTLHDFTHIMAPVIRRLTRQIKQHYPNIKIIYYSKHTSLDHLLGLEDPSVDVLGIDYRHDLVSAMRSLSSDYMIQGNLDPVYLHLSWEHLEEHLGALWRSVSNSKINLDRWIMGLGHGVLPKTPQDNVRKSVEFIHTTFRY